MFPPLSEIKVLRRKLGLTQQQLAKATGFTQSFIAKIEYDKTTPAYPKAAMIFEYLEQQGKNQELKARDVMSRKIVSISPSSNLGEAVRKFKVSDISQLPVIAEGHLVGVVSENDVLSAMVEGKRSAQVSQVMEDTPPIVPPNASIKAVSSLLRYCPLVAVQDQGKLVGVISKADLLEPLYGK